MDLSKLPKLSQTPAPPSADPVLSDAVPVAGAGEAPKVELFCRCGAPITPGTNFCSHCGANYYEAVGGRRRAASDDVAGGPMWIEAFLGVAIGIFLMMIAPGGIKYLSAKVTGKPYLPYLHPTDQGVYVDYLQYLDPTTGATSKYTYRDLFDHYWSDMAITAFALSLILEGIVLAVARNKWIILVSGLLIAAATLLNVWYVMASYSRVSPITKTTYGMPLLSVVAVIFGVVMAGYQFWTFAELRRRR
jgi:hypothetical protein